MLYTEEFIEFIKKVKAEYPNWKELHKKLERGDISSIGNYLAEKSDLEMDAEEIVQAFNEGRGEDVFQSAKKCVRRKKLHSTWRKINADWWGRRVAVNV